MKGNGNLCRTLVKSGACLGSMNKDGITIFNYQVATKQLLHRLLDSLTQEAPWAEKDLCLECGTKFSLTMRKHHWFVLIFSLFIFFHLKYENIEFELIEKK